MIGLGRMGSNIVRRLMGGGHSVSGFDPDAQARQSLRREGMIPVDSLELLVAALREEKGPVRVWLMLPSGPPVDEMIKKLAPLLSPGDIIVDGGHSRYTDTMRRAKSLAQSDIGYVDAGTSGAIRSLNAGGCLMVGGDTESVRSLEPVFETLASPGGYLHVGPSGSGHFVRMVHDGIECALLQAYGEGFDLLKNGPFEVDLAAVSRLWNQGGDGRARFLELLADILGANPTLSGIRGYVEESGEARWTAETAIEFGVFAPVLTLALMERFASRQGDIFSYKINAALRNESGGKHVFPEDKATA